MAKPEIVLQQNSAPNHAELSLLERAQAANDADHKMAFWAALRKYRKAVFWACIFSFTLTMQAADATQVNFYSILQIPSSTDVSCNHELTILKTTTFYGQDQFKQQFGSIDKGVLEISAKWQTAIQQAMACGELVGLAIAGYLSNYYGWKPILSGMMIWLTGSLFLFAFAKNLGYLVAAMVMCG